jgi:hypothetical protein
MARVPDKLASNDKKSGALIGTFGEMTGTPFKYDPELMEKARWIIERGLHRPPVHEIDPRQELPLPAPPPREPEESDPATRA